ncbi:hypothetical protein V6Z11_D10G091900 [Gossypium hirsutum]
MKANNGEDLKLKKDVDETLFMTPTTSTTGNQLGGINTNF